MAALSVLEATALTSLRTFLLSLPLVCQSGPIGFEVIEGQINRVPEPEATDFAVMTATIRQRMATNQDSFLDCAYLGSISGTLMTVAVVQLGTLSVGQPVMGSGVSAGILIAAQVGGTGGTGTYTLSGTANTGGQTQLAGGTLSLMQETRLTVQIDVHGPNSGDNAQIISTAMRDGYAYDAFTSYGPGVFPLYADDPRQVPFINAENQYEYRWIIDCQLQINPALAVPQAAAAQLVASIKELDAVHPPA